MPNQIEMNSSLVVEKLNDTTLMNDSSSFSKKQTSAADIKAINQDIAANTSHLKGVVSESYKIFNDPIHGHIELNSACMAIIDTPEFQRLRYVKQLGLVYFVYPGASHNRFEHSIGTCHLSGQFAQKLRENQPHLGIDVKDIICVQLAGLCHDLGHGPLSHLFDEKFIPSYSKKIHWKHEDASVAMLGHIIEKHALMKSDGILRKTYKLDDTDILFIKEMIQGKSFSADGEWVCKGRHSAKAYLYEEAANLYNMFYTRWTLHRYAYQHRVKCVIETMVLDAMLLADKHLTFRGKDGKRLHLSECIYDMEAYTQLTDDVISMIQHSTSKHPDMVEARAVISRVYYRDLYTCVHETRPLKPVTAKLDEVLIREEICALAQATSAEKSLIRVHITYLDFGMKNQNPVEKLNVYSKDDVNKARPLNKDEASRILGPTIFSEIIVRVMCCSGWRTAEDKKRLEDAARRWEESFGEEETQTSVSKTVDIENDNVGSNSLAVHEASAHCSSIHDSVCETEIRNP